MNTKNTEIAEITGQKPEAKSDSILNADNSVSTSNKSVRCDACGCAFTPEILTQREGEIEYTFFRCAYCQSPMKNYDRTLQSMWLSRRRTD